MPLFEYRCQDCNQINTFLEKSNPTPGFLLWLRPRKRCKGCGSKKLTKVFSSFAVSSKQSTADMLNDISKMGPVQFVPDYRRPGPPPGGCPYQQKEEKPASESKSREKIKLT
jgi:predicted nucleic acid-binding Zn ribbon protein